MNVGFGLLCILTGTMSIISAPIGSVTSYIAGILGIVGGYFVFIGLVTEEI